MAGAETTGPADVARVLFVHHRSELGGAPTSLSYLIRTLAHEDFEPHVFCPAGPAADLFRESGATVHTGPVAAFTHIWASTYTGRRWLLFVRELLRLPLHVVSFHRLVKGTRFALVHLNDSPLIPAAVVARLSGIPIVWHLRSALPAERQLRSFLLRRVIRRLAAATIAINDDVAASFGVDADVVPNSVDLDRFAPGDSRSAKEALGLDVDVPAVAYFGFIYPSKGFRDFIDAAALLRARGTKATFLIVGGPVRGDEFFASLGGRAIELLGLARNYDRDARLLVARLGLDKQVKFVDFTPDTTQLYQASDVVVSPSRGPELGRPVIEASACGRAVVATGSLSGAGIVRPDETGVLVPQRSPDVLAAALQQLLSDDGYRRSLGSAARSHAELNFDQYRNARRVIEIYRRLVEAGDHA